jgi:hypothetical protein
MNEPTGLARRYHWHSAAVRDFTCEPHTGIVGDSRGEILNLVDHRAKPAQDALLALGRERPDRTLDEIRTLAMPRHHDVRAPDVDLKRLGAVLAVSYEKQFRDFASFLLMENLGPRTLQSLSLIAEVVHGTPARFQDPARFSFAHGGKDGHPFPVPLKTYDESLQVLQRSLERARLGEPDRSDGLKRLDKLVRFVEQRYQPVAHFENIMNHERQISPSLGGRTVMDDRRRPPAQLRLF